MTGTNLQGTNIISMIVPTNHADTYATHDSFYGKGGWREVDTLAERDAIPQERRRRGMVVFVRETNKCYLLQNSVYNGGWVTFPSVDSVADIVNEAIAQGEIVIDLSNCVTKSDFDDTMRNYYTATQVESKLTIVENNVKDWVGEQGFLTEHQSLAGYATKTELDRAVVNKADKEELNSKADKTAFDALEERVEEHIADADAHTARKEDLENYYTKAESDAKYLTEQDISGKADKTALEALESRVEDIETGSGFVPAHDYEEKCEEIDTQISSLQVAVTAIQELLSTPPYEIIEDE